MAIRRERGRGDSGKWTQIVFVIGKGEDRLVGINGDLLEPHTSIPISNISSRGIKMRIKNESKDWRNVIVLSRFSILFPGTENSYYSRSQRNEGYSSNFYLIGNVSILLLK